MGPVNSGRSPATRLPAAVGARAPTAALGPVLGEGSCLSESRSPRRVELLLEAVSVALPLVPVALDSRQLLAQPFDRWWGCKARANPHPPTPSSVRTGLSRGRTARPPGRCGPRSRSRGLSAGWRTSVRQAWSVRVQTGNLGTAARGAPERLACCHMVPSDSRCMRGVGSWQRRPSIAFGGRRLPVRSHSCRWRVVWGCQTRGGGRRLCHTVSNPSWGLWADLLNASEPPCQQDERVHVQGHD